MILYNRKCEMCSRLFQCTPLDRDMAIWRCRACRPEKDRTKQMRNSAKKKLPTADEAVAELIGLSQKRFVSGGAAALRSKKRHSNTGALVKKYGG